MINSLSIVICTFNGKRRIAPTLQHIAAQKPISGTEWEVVVIDNASTDGTGDDVWSMWPNQHPVPFRVLREEKPGLTNARMRGFKETTSQIVAFVDDDNWIQEGWVQGVLKVMGEKHDVGALGVFSEPVFECDPPDWFWDHFFYYAVHKPGDHRSLIYGAGLCLRRSALDDLFKNGFEFMSMDRKGKSLSSSGDVEICQALELSGWKVHFEENIRLKHFMPKDRLNQSYLRRLYRGIGESGVLLDGYGFKSATPKSFRSFRTSWVRQFLGSVAKIATKPSVLFSTFKHPDLYKKEILECEYNLGRSIGLWRNKMRYSQIKDSIAKRKWINKF